MLSNFKLVPSKSTTRFWKFGLPFVLFVVVGSFGLAEFTDIKIQRRDEKVQKVTAEEAKKYQAKKGKSSVTLEDVYKNMQENLNIDDWENKRGPRPWEKSNS